MTEKVNNRKKGNSKISAGIDIGVFFSKAVLLQDSNIISEGVVYSGNNYKTSAEKALKLALQKCDISLHDIDGIVSTGCGANLVPYEYRRTPEIICQGLGVNWLFPSARLIIEISAQMAKVIRLDERGRAIDFNVSEKCATGSGSILNVLANILGVKMSELGELSKKAQSFSKFATSCTVFLETEVISRISEGEKVEDIVAGVYGIISDKIWAMTRNLTFQKDCVFTGGAALDTGLKAALEKRLELPLLIPQNPLTTGAIGAAIAAQRGTQISDKN
jgi:(R)-2-hydroxyacyl-CoA dehydratese activating ATPase